MTQQTSLKNMTVVQLRALAKEKHVSFPAGIKKQEMIERLLQAEKPTAESAAQTAPADVSVQEAQAPVQASPAEATEKETPVSPAEAPAPSKDTEEAPAAPQAKTQIHCARRKPLCPPLPRMPREPVAAPAHESAADEQKAAPVAPAAARETSAETAPASTELPRRTVPERRPLRSQASAPVSPDIHECREARGILDIQNDGYGFLRAIDPNQKDVYVSVAQIRRFALRNGDLVCGRTRPERENEKYLAMLFISSINGLSPEESAKRPQFENLTPIYPNRRLRLEHPQEKTDLAIRLLDLVAPIGYGQRGLIVSPPKAGKTTLLKEIASAVSLNAPQAELIVLLIDERPEEVTDMMRSVKGQVFYSTFDQDSAHHIAVAEQTLEKARRSVENGKDVILLLDSITRLARAANLTCAPSGRLLSGGLDPAALAMPKRFFGSARCLEEGGSLTILATALIDTGSRLDDIIYEEFKGTGNMELHLDRRLQERRVFPAIDLYRSGTRHEEKLLTADELSAIWKVRKLLSGNPEDATELMIDMMAKTARNEDFLDRLESWLNMMDARNIRK